MWLDSQWRYVRPLYWLQTSHSGQTCEQITSCMCDPVDHWVQVFNKTLQYTNSDHMTYVSLCQVLRPYYISHDYHNMCMHVLRHHNVTNHVTTWLPKPYKIPIVIAYLSCAVSIEPLWCHKTYILHGIQYMWFCASLLNMSSIRFK